jgi:hypothetical protein
MVRVDATLTIHQGLRLPRIVVLFHNVYAFLEKVAVDCVTRGNTIVACVVRVACACSLVRHSEHNKRRLCECYHATRDNDLDISGAVMCREQLVGQE